MNPTLVWFLKMLVVVLCAGGGFVAFGFAGFMLGHFMDKHGWARAEEPIGVVGALCGLGAGIWLASRLLAG